MCDKEDESGTAAEIDLGSKSEFGGFGSLFGRRFDDGSLLEDLKEFASGEVNATFVSDANDPSEDGVGVETAFGGSEDDGDVIPEGEAFAKLFFISLHAHDGTIGGEVPFVDDDETTSVVIHNITR